MKKRFFAAALAATMVVSSAMTAMAAETISSTAWWSFTGVSSDYALTGDGSVTLSIGTSADTTAFNVEVYNPGTEAANDGYYFTTGVIGDAWLAELLDGQGTVTAPGAWTTTVVGGNEIEVTVTREGKTLSVVYEDVTAGTTLAEMTAVIADSVALPEALNVHVIAQIGTLEVAQVVDTEEETTTVNGSGSTGDVEDETTTVNGSGSTGDVEDETTTSKTEEETTTTKTEEETTTAKAEASTSVVVDKAAGETVEVSVAENSAFADVAKVNVYQINANGEKVLVGTFDVVDGKVQFTSKGAGTYVLEAVTEEETTTAKTEGETTTVKAEETTTAKEATGTDQPKTGDSAPIVILAAIATLAGAGVVVSRKKRA